VFWLPKALSNREDGEPNSHFIGVLKLPGFAWWTAEGGCPHMISE